MDFERVYALHKFFINRRYPAQLQDILSHLEISKNTFNIARNYMCDVLGAPIKNKRGQGYFYDLESGETYELPGLWFSGKEIISLALLDQINDAFQPNVVKELLSPISMRLDKLLEKQNITRQDWRHRIKVVSQWQRSCEPEFFADVAHALLQRKQLEIDYHSWQRNVTDSRVISPQRLVYYRDNWYLDAWCHKRQELRTFSLAAIRDLRRLETRAMNIEPQQLDEHVMPGYGIFAGKIQDIAQLKFSINISKRVSRENWHPEQKAEWDDAGHYLLSVPYSDTRELIRDILHFGSDIEVLAPASLRGEITKELEKTLGKYF